MFRKLRGVDVDVVRQGLIFFTCLDYKRQPKKIRDKIDRLCDKCGGGYSAALKDLVTTPPWEMGVTCCAMRHHVSESTLYRIRKAFYEAWDASD